jgi:hypothetical protein
MKASELRIGNLIYNKQGNIVYVNTNHLTLLSYGIENEFNPIPLTEEWLLKFGFEVSGGEISYNKNKLSIYFGDTILSGKNGRTYWNSWTILEESPKYVHQLQNLYFALTGEELTIKNK